MVSRSLLALFALALFFAVASAASFEEEVNSKFIAKAVKEVAEFLNKEVIKINNDCFNDVYKTCKINPFRHPKKYFLCAKNYILEHKEHCYNTPAEGEVVVDVDEQDKERGFKEGNHEAIKKVVKEVAKLLKKEISKINKDCITEIYNACDINALMHPRKFYLCAEDYFLKNKEHCYNSQ